VVGVVLPPSLPLQATRRETSSTTAEWRIGGGDERGGGGSRDGVGRPTSHSFCLREGVAQGDPPSRRPGANHGQRGTFPEQ
jgi:hypothetical protein